MKNTSHTERIKERLNILDVVGGYVQLEKAGKTWKGKSPFTNEKTASFFVSPEKGFFYCFSSGKGGDIFTFIQEIERVDFRTALAQLAERAGVDLGTSSGPSTKPLYLVMEDACAWYEQSLNNNTVALDYLGNQRGIKPETLKQFRIGFAPDDWSDLYTYLKQKGHSDQHMEQAGLIVSKDKKRFYNRFRSRIMFPLMDSQGRVVAFSGRIFGEHLKTEKNQAKYVNSPESPLFHKSSLLYGYHLAKQVLGQSGYALVVEGQVDLVMAHQAGTPQTVAVSGTGLTDEHLDQISRFTDTLYLAFDADNAGQKAARRSVVKAYTKGMYVRMVELPAGSDPADVIKSSPTQWSVYLKDARDYLDYRLNLFEQNHEQASFDERHRLVSHDLFEILLVMKSSIHQELYLKKLAEFLRISIDAVRHDFQEYEEAKTGQKTPTITQESDDEQVSRPSDTHKQPLQHTDTQSQSLQIDLQNILAATEVLQEDYEEFWTKQGDALNTLFQQYAGQDLKHIQENQDETYLGITALRFRYDSQPTSASQVFDYITQSLKAFRIHTLEQQSKNLLETIRHSSYTESPEMVQKHQLLHQEILKEIDSIKHSYYV